MGDFEVYTVNGSNYLGDFNNREDALKAANDSGEPCILFSFIKNLSNTPETVNPA